tara:strand:+ start:2285 stop:2500 length:216 start_codon:yes stop_codon:yes gene_type:complete
MTKKDYIAIAAIVKKLRKTVAENNNPYWATNMISMLTSELANYFDDDNQRFDRGTFIDATYLTKEEERLPL